MQVLVLNNGDPHLELLQKTLVDLGVSVGLYANDDLGVDDIETLAPERIIVASGEDMPVDAGITLPVIRELALDVPVLGIGLGMICIAAAFGARTVVGTPPPASLEHEGTSILADLPSPLAVVADPALVLAPRLLPAGLRTIAWSDDNHVMGLAHDMLPLVGVMALPASPDLAQHVIQNFLALPQLRHP